MKLKQGDWKGGELCALMHRKSFLETIELVEVQLFEAEGQLNDRLLFELREIKKLVKRAGRHSWFSLLIAQAGESWISSFLGKLQRATGRWGFIKRSNGSEAIEYELVSQGGL